MDRLKYKRVKTTETQNKRDGMNVQKQQGRWKWSEVERERVIRLGLRTQRIFEKCPHNTQREREREGRRQR